MTRGPARFPGKNSPTPALPPWSLVQGQSTGAQPVDGAVTPVRPQVIVSTRDSQVLTERPGWLRSMQLARYLGVSTRHWQSHILPTLRETKVSTIPISPSSRAWSVAEAEEALRQKWGAK